MKLVYLTEGGNSISGSKICLNPSECSESGANRDYDSNGKVGQGALHPTINFWHNNVQTLTFFSSLSPCCRPYISAALCDRTTGGQKPTQQDVMGESIESLFLKKTFQLKLDMAKLGPSKNRIKNRILIMW